MPLLHQMLRFNSPQSLKFPRCHGLPHATSLRASPGLLTRSSRQHPCMANRLCCILCISFMFLLFHHNSVDFLLHKGFFSWILSVLHRVYFVTETFLMRTNINMCLLNNSVRKAIWSDSVSRRDWHKFRTCAQASARLRLSHVRRRIRNVHSEARPRNRAHLQYQSEISTETVYKRCC